MAGCNINKHCRGGGGGGGGGDAHSSADFFFGKGKTDVNRPIYYNYSGDPWKIHRFWLIYCVCIDSYR